LLEAVAPVGGRARVRCTPRAGEARHSDDLFEWHDDKERGEVILVVKPEVVDGLKAAIAAACSTGGGDADAQLAALEQTVIAMQKRSLSTRSLFDGFLTWILHCKVHKARCILSHALYAPAFKALGRALHSLARLSLFSQLELLRSITSPASPKSAQYAGDAG